MRRLALLLLLLAAPAFGQSVKLPAEVKVDPKEWAVIPFEADGGPTRWKMPDKGLEEIPLRSLLGEYEDKAKCRIFKAKLPGRYRVWAFTAKARETDPKIVDVSDSAECVIVVGEAPEPVPPGPGPGPTPDPVDPDPFLSPGERSAAGLKCLIVYETADLSKMPKSQLAILYGAEVRNYLRVHCLAEANGRPAWRMWDQNVDPKDDAPLWQKAFAAPRKSVPWIYLGNGKNGYSGPLPLTDAEALKLMAKFGG